MAIEGFGLPDNLMVPGAVPDGGGHSIVLPLDDQDRPFDALRVFERCVELAASTMGCRRPPPGSVVSEPSCSGMTTQFVSTAV
jgi:hypothetical protein